MLNIIEKDGSFIALEMGGKLRSAEIGSIVELMEKATETNAKTHLFAEVQHFTGIELDGMGEHLKRSMPLLGKLDHFGRIAIVADQRWLRTVAKIESAVLPNISYETFLPAERDRAFAWAKGEEDRPHPPALKIIETSNPDVIGFEFDGKASAEELRAATKLFVAEVEKGGAKRILGRIRRYGGVEASGVFDPNYMGMKLRMLGHVERYALVGGPSWLKAMVEILNPLLQVDVRYFEETEEGAAWSWLGARPTEERPLAS
jgi:hypothetical protein